MWILLTFRPKTDSAESRFASFSKMMQGKKSEIEKKLDVLKIENKKFEERKAKLAEELKQYDGQKVGEI
jgi:hypothetical protein